MLLLTSSIQHLKKPPNQDDKGPVFKDIFFINLILDHSILKNLSLGSDKVDKIRQIWREWLNQISDPANVGSLMNQMELVRRSKIGNQDFIRIHTDHIAKLLDARGRAMKVRELHNWFKVSASIKSIS